jgi:para-nitrobenzyl esterase
LISETAGEVIAHLGIRYATAPRFRPPEVVDDVEVRGEFGPWAPQPVGPDTANPMPTMTPGPMAEDCLFLNVWASSDAAGLPVMVWVHGGAYVTGGAGSPTFDGAALARHGVVVVTINYRLGALGFYAGNWGLLDVAAALKWVRDHIESFGGDPSRVTVFGESAGAITVLHLFAMPAARGLFHRAIAQSPGAQVHGPANSRRVDDAFLRALGQDATTASIDEILIAQQAVALELTGPEGAMPWAPYVDGDVLERSPLESALAGDAQGVPIMLGTTSEEMRLFVRRSFDTKPRDAILSEMAASLYTALLVDVDGEELRRCAQSYGELSNSELYTRLLTDVQIGAPMLRTADALATHGAPVYSYEFDWPAPRVGAAHQIELPFVFGTLDHDEWSGFLGVDDDARRLAQETTTRWTAFATHGRPDVPALAGWPCYAPPERMTRTLGRTGALGPARATRALDWKIGTPRTGG